MISTKKRFPKLADFLREAKAYHPAARSPHFAKLAALRAEMVYGLPADEAYRRITGDKKKGKGEPDDKRDEKKIVETMVELETYEEGAQPPPWMRGRDPIDRAFEEGD
jgi:hypothetical protein